MQGQVAANNALNVVPPLHQREIDPMETTKNHLMMVETEETNNEGISGEIDQDTFIEHELVKQQAQKKRKLRNKSEKKPYKFDPTQHRISMLKKDIDVKMNHIK